MSRLIAISMAVGCLAAGPSDPHQLNESQLERLGTAEDGPATVDAAGFYALLENAADWSGKEAGAVVPDYDAIRREPAAWRGRRCLVEGTLERVIKPKLSRLGWERVEGALVRINTARAEPEPEDYVIVYLTDPPAWPWKRQDRGTTWPERVRLVGRFYALSNFNTEGGDSKSYAVFVGQTLRVLQPTGPAPRSEVSTLLYVTIGVAFVAYVAWRIKMSRGPRDQPKVREFLEQRRRERGEAGPRGGGATDERDLPPNPIDALDALSEKHEHPRE